MDCAALSEHRIPSDDKERKNFFSQTRYFYISNIFLYFL